jgi:hypothetical protein
MMRQTTIIAFCAALTGPVWAQTATHPGSVVAWDYATGVSGLTGFECRVGTKIIGQAGRNARSMPIGEVPSGTRTVECRANGAAGVNSEWASLEVTHDTDPTLPAKPTAFCRTIGAECLIEWAQSGAVSGFELTLNDALVGVAGPDARSMACPPFATGSQTLELRARTANGLRSLPATVTWTHPTTGELCE